jgi:YHS domain-containing protein
MHRILLTSLALGGFLWVAGCTENAKPASAMSDTSAAARTASAKSHAECLVCKYENDLACVDVDVDDKTPKTAFNGKDYFFCSDTCRKAFEKNPQKYAGVK